MISNNFQVRNPACEECIKLRIALLKSEEKIEKLTRKCKTQSMEIRTLKSQLKDETNKRNWFDRVTNVMSDY